MTIFTLIIKLFGSIFTVLSLFSVRFLGLLFVAFGFLSMTSSIFRIPVIYSLNGISFISFAYVVQFLLSFIAISLGIKFFKSTSLIKSNSDLFTIDKLLPSAYKKYLITCLILFAFNVIIFIENIQTQMVQSQSDFLNFEALYLMNFSCFYFSILTFILTIIHIIFSTQYRRSINNKNN